MGAPSMEISVEAPGPSADEALARLVAGNERFLRGEARCAGMRREGLAELAQGQRPYATILGCSDSRVPPEWIFDADCVFTVLPPSVEECRSTPP